jgi:hypothetical protein
MNVNLLLLFLHITVIFSAITVGFGSTTLLRVAYMTGQVAPLRGVGIAVAKLAPIVPILYITGGLLGLLTAIVFGQNLLAPWLVIAYVFFAIAIYIGAVEGRKWGMALGAQLAKTPDGPLTTELSTMFTDRRVVVITVIDYLLPVILIFDMVVKPFS